MADLNNLSPAPARRCYGCLSTSRDRELHTYYVKKLIFKSMLQMDQLILCYLCKRVAIQTEKFIHNIETSQALFDDSKNDLNFNYENYKTIIHPLINLTCWINCSTDIINLSSMEPDELLIKNEFEDLTAELSSVIEIKKEEQSHDGYLTETLVDVELEESASCSGQNKNDNDNYYVNKQDDDDFKYPLTEVKKRKKIQKDFCAGVITLTKKELQEERAQKAIEKKYLDATFKCENCIKGFVMRTPYENHLKLHSKERGDIECDICKQRLKTKCQMELHYRYHVERYKCSKCDDTRNCWTSLKDHYLRKHSEGHFEYSCPICFKQFRFRSSFQKHKSDKHENRERIKCKYCDRTFASESAIGYHMKFNHTEEESVKLKPYTCKECGLSFKMQQKLKNHMVTHTSRRDHYCVECDKSFKTRTALNLHFRTVVAHNFNRNSDRQEFIYSCPHCDKRFPQKKGLSRHISNIHLNQTLLQCSQCGKTFKTKKRLSVHIMSHGEGYEQLKKHSCTICNKRFHEKGVLAKHMNTHTGAKPYQCSQCPAQFAHSGSLYNHVKLVHLNLTRKGTPKVANLGTIGRKQRN